MVGMAPAMRWVLVTFLEESSGTLKSTWRGVLVRCHCEVSSELSSPATLCDSSTRGYHSLRNCKPLVDSIAECCSIGVEARSSSTQELQDTYSHKDPLSSEVNILNAELVRERHDCVSYSCPVYSLCMEL